MVDNSSNKENFKSRGEGSPYVAVKFDVDVIPVDISLYVYTLYLGHSSAIRQRDLFKVNTKLNHDSVNINFNVASSDQKIFLPSESVIVELS